MTSPQKAPSASRERYPEKESFIEKYAFSPEWRKLSGKWKVNSDGMVSGVNYKDFEHMHVKSHGDSNKEENEAFNGGDTHIATLFMSYVLAQEYSKNKNKYAVEHKSHLDSLRFTGFNDTFHHNKNPDSSHAKGLAFDFTFHDPNIIPAENVLSTFGPTAAQFTKDFNGMNIAGLKVADEYNKPSGHASGRHIHVQLDKKQADTIFEQLKPTLAQHQERTYLANHNVTDFIDLHEVDIKSATPIILSETQEEGDTMIPTYRNTLEKQINGINPSEFAKKQPNAETNPIINSMMVGFIPILEGVYRNNIQLTDIVSWSAEKIIKESGIDSNDALVVKNIHNIQEILSTDSADGSIGFLMRNNMHSLLQKYQILFEDINSYSPISSATDFFANETVNSVTKTGVGLVSGLAGAMLARKMKGGVLSQFAMGITAMMMGKVGYETYGNKNGGFTQNLKGESMNIFEMAKTGFGMAKGASMKGFDMFSNFWNSDKSGSEKTIKTLLGIGSVFVAIWGAKKIYKNKKSTVSNSSSGGLIKKALIAMGLIGGAVVAAPALADGVKKLSNMASLPLETLKEQKEQLEAALLKQKEDLEKQRAALIESGREATEEATRAMKNSEAAITKAHQQLANVTQGIKTHPNASSSDQALPLPKPVGPLPTSTSPSLQSVPGVIPVVSSSPSPVEKIDTVEVIQNNWKAAVAILENNGLLTGSEKIGLTSSEDFQKFMQNEYKNEPLFAKIQKTIESQTGVNAAIGLSTAIILMFLIKGKLKAIAGGGAVFGILEIAKQDGARNRMEFEKSINAGKELYDHFHGEMKSAGYGEGAIRKLMNDIFGTDINALIDFSFLATEQWQENNNAALAEIDTLVSNISEENDWKDQYIKNRAKLDLLLAGKRDVRVFSHELQEIFLPLHFLGIVPHKIHIENGNYTFIFSIDNKEVVLRDFPINLFPDISPEEEKEQDFIEKEHELMGALVKDLRGFEKYIINYPESLAAARNEKPRIKSTLGSIIKSFDAAEKNLHAGIPLGAGFWDTHYSLLQQLEVFREIDVTKSDEGMIFFSALNEKGRRVRVLGGVTSLYKKNNNTPKNLTAYDSNRIIDTVTKRTKELGIETTEGMFENIQKLYLSLPQNSDLKKHFAQYLKDKNNGELGIELMSDGFWWGEFFRLLIVSPTDSLFAKVESGIFTVVTPAGKFALFNLLDPLTVQVEAFGLIGDGVSLGEYISRSFIGAGVILAPFGAMKGFMAGKGVTGKALGTLGGGVNSFFLGVKINPFLRGLRFGAKRRLVNSIQGTPGEKEIKASSQLLEIHLNRIRSGHFLPLQLQRIRTYGGDPYEYLLKRYANSVRELNLLRKSQEKVSIIANITGLASELEQEQRKIKKLYESIYKHGNQSGDTFVDLAEKYAQNSQYSMNTVSYLKFLKKNAPDRYYEKKLTIMFRSEYQKTDAITEKYKTTRKNIEESRKKAVAQNKNAEKVYKKLIESSYRKELATLVRHYTPANASEVKQALQGLQTTMNSAGYEKYNKTIAKCISQIDRGKAPKIPFHLMNVNINPFSHARSVGGLNRVSWTSSALSGTGKILTYGGRGLAFADMVGNGLSSGFSVLSAMDENRSDSISSDTYWLDSTLNGVFAAAKAKILWSEIYSAGFATIPAALAYAVVSGAENITMGGINSRMEGEMNSRDYSTRWTKEKLLREVCFMETENLDDGFKNILNILPGSDVTKNKKAIRQTIWAALAIVEQRENEFFGDVGIEFLKAYAEVIEIRTENNSTPPSSPHVGLEIHNDALFYATHKAEIMQQSIDHGGSPNISVEYSENEIISIIETRKKVKNNIEIENGSLNLLEQSIYTIAKQLREYKGDPDIDQLKEFLSEPRKKENGLYWDEGNNTWKVYRYQSYLWDIEIEGDSPEEQNFFLLNLINESSQEIFVSDHFGTGQHLWDGVSSGIDKVGEKVGLWDFEDNKNRESSENGALAMSYIMSENILKKSNTIESIQKNARSVFEAGVMVLAVLDGETSITLEDVQNRYMSSFFGRIKNFDILSYDESGKWYWDRKSINTESFDIKTINTKGLGVGHGETIGRINKIKTAFRIGAKLFSQKDAQIEKSSESPS